MRRFIREALGVVVLLPVLAILYVVGWLFYDTEGEP